MLKIYQPLQLDDYYDDDDIDPSKINYGFTKQQQRDKRFFNPAGSGLGSSGGGYQVGCLKGVRCCQMANCRPFCSLCSEFIDVPSYGGGGGGHGGGYGPTGGGGVQGGYNGACNEWEFSLPDSILGRQVPCHQDWVFPHPD